MTRGGGYRFDDDPWAYLREMQDRINRIIEDSYRRTTPGSPLSTDAVQTEFCPAVDVRETDKAVIVSCDLPGMEKDKIDVVYKDGDLTIKGSRETVKEKSDNAGLIINERSFGSFEKVIPIDADIKEDKIQAEYKNGVLTVTLPKTEAAIKPGKKIQII